jgi:hypothetical protein
MKSSDHNSQHRNSHTPVRFSTGGYLELRHSRGTGSPGRSSSLSLAKRHCKTHSRYKGIRGGPTENGKKSAQTWGPVSRDSDSSSLDTNEPAAQALEDDKTADEASRPDSNRSSKEDTTSLSSNTLGSKANDND